MALLQMGSCECSPFVAPYFVTITSITSSLLPRDLICFMHIHCSCSFLCFAHLLTHLPKSLILFTSRTGWTILAGLCWLVQLSGALDQGYIAALILFPCMHHPFLAAQAGLHSLAPALDGPSFRDIWRAVTVPVNRFLFNYVATEAFFSQAGTCILLCESLML